ncbi:aspartate/glutamate racemase family protein [Lacibacterium aquatile]|uniref:Aspartate/glutamate racemase family protein n=1 Tax=Lacibacterium aquatile TaxID=1168082 RepID=A0ABW5DSK1_9PROT
MPSHFLLVNGNTTDALTGRLTALAQARLPAGSKVRGITAGFGSDYIASRSACAVAGHAVLEALASSLAEGTEPSVAIIACFGEPGIAAARELMPCPVVGMAEASVLSALQLGSRYGIVTVGERWPAMLEDYLRGIGLDERLAGIVKVPGRALDLADRPDEARAAVRSAIDTAIDRHGAEVVIIGGAALSGLAAQLQDSVEVPLVDSLEAALAQATALAQLAPRKARRGSYAPVPPLASQGLSPALASLLSHTRA